MKHAQDATSHGSGHTAGATGHSGHYWRLLMMMAASFVAMFILMYAMVDRFENAVTNVNQVYMAALMSAPMLALELLLMGRMYPNRRLNLALIAVAIVVGIASWMLIRQQTGIGDRQFLRSMIPHHAGAVLMCKEASITSSEVQRLCQGIVASQTDEIALMRRLLDEGVNVDR